MENFTSNYLGLLKRTGQFDQITDGVIPISTIQVSKMEKLGNVDIKNNKEFCIKLFNEYPELQYSPPTIVYDKFAQEQELLDPDIKKIYDSLVSVRELGFEIISLNVIKGWFRKQNAQYKIRKASMISDSASVLNQIPQRHFVEFDRANKRVRLVGKNCKDSFTGAIGVTEWVEI